MKFTCDSCGAQYLIADEKIGARGVKVRCKKCTHVIILRPSELATSKPEGNGNGNGNGPMTGGSAASVPVAPSVAAMQAVSPSMLPNDVVAATSSDLGLSQEFKALGFDEPGQAEPRAATLSVGLDLQSTPSVHGDTSPFSAERAGGSLDLVPPEAPEAEATAVQSRPAKPFADDETDVFGDSDRPATPSADDLSAAAGLGQASPEMPEDEEASTRVENLSDLAASEAASGIAQNDVHEEEDATLAFDNPAERSDKMPAAVISHTLPADEGLAEPGLAEAGLGFGAAFNDAPLKDLRSSIDAEMDGLPDGLGEDLGANTVVAPSPVSEADFDEPESDPSNHSPEAPSIDGLDDGLHVAGLGDTPYESQADSQAAADAADDDDIAGEIGSAFEAMFAGDDGGVGSELEALQEALGADGTNKAETRVFDTEAMAKVEAEQDRAGASTEHEAVQAKEWFVAIDEEQIGPLSKSEVQAQWDEGKLQSDSLCWRAGMGDWTAIQDTEQLADIVPPAPEPRVPTVIGGDAPEPASDDDDSDDDLSALSAAAEATPPPPPPDIKPEPEPVAEPRAASEPAWRPSAASALASLAAEELSDNSYSAPAPALGAAPASTSPSSDGIKALAASDALEKLLEGDPDKSVASQFGAAEQSESMVRPLPRRADTVSSLPLRDPTADKPKSKGMLYAVIGGFALLILAVLAVGMMLRSGEPSKTPPGAVAKAGELVMAPAGELAVADVAAEAKKAAEAKALADAEAELVKQAAEAKALADAEALKAEAAKLEAAKLAKKPRKRGSRRRRRTTPKPEPTPEVARATTEPIKAVAPKRTGSAEDDLLGAAAPRRRRPRSVAPEPALPEQLDDSDVLSVLRSNRRDVKRCLTAQSSADPSLGGTMTVELVIRRSGRPKGVRVREDKFKRSAVGTCMIAAVKKWRFAKFSGKAMPLDFPVRVRAQ